MRQSSPLIFLIHGIMGHPKEFDPLVHTLERHGYNTHRVCLPQHGDEPGNLRSISWEDMLDSCQKEIQQCRQTYGDNIHLVGFSLGGALSLILTRNQSVGFRSVTLVAAPYKPVFNLEYGQYHLKNFFNRFLPGTQYWHQQNTGYPKPFFRVSDLPRFYRQMDSFFLEVQDAAQVLQIPSLLIHSPYDLTVPYEHSEWLYNTIPAETNFVTLLEGGHQVFPYYVQGVVEQAILQHLQSADLKTRPLLTRH